MLPRLNAKKTGRRLIIDHTHTTQFKFQTGVQRVVKKICEHARTASIGSFDDVIAVMLTPTGFQPSLQYNETIERLETSHPKTDAVTWGKRIQHARKWLSGSHGWFQRPTLIPGSELVFRPGDTLLLPDAYWALPNAWPSVAEARLAGARTAVVIYDLIPHTHSEIYGEQGAEGFRKYVRSAFEHADCFIAISRSVRDQLAEELPTIVGRPIDDFHLDYFELGAEFDDPQGTVQDPIAAVFKCSEDIRPLLMVGTLEARKNHHFVLDTMDKLWETFPNRKLCILGRPGWKGESVIERIRKHNRYNKQLFWFDNASDADLLYCYQNSSSMIFASIAEGFGLPIVESLWHGCNTIVSDIPIHREVGKDRCSYFELNDSDSLLRILLEREQLALGPDGTKLRPRTSAIRPTSWPQSVNGLVRKLDQATSPVQLATI